MMPLVRKLLRREMSTNTARRKPGEARRKKLPKYTSFKLHKPIKGSKYKPLPSAWSLWKSSLKTIWRYKKTFASFLFVYAVLYVVFVRGLSDGVDLAALKAQIQETLGISLSGMISSATLFGVLLTTSNGTVSEAGAIYQILLFTIGSLALIWLLRQMNEGIGGLKAKDGFYAGMQPFVPFIIVCFILFLELVPMLTASYIFNTVQANGLLISGIETFAVGVVVFMLCLLSLYLFSGSIAAVYIVALPGTRPIQAIRASHGLLRLHRWSVARKLLLLAVLLFVFAALIFIPLLLLLPNGYEWIAQVVFFACSILTFAIAHSYLYTLYRSLL